MKTLIVDLLPLKTDGSNGGNSLFILALLKRLLAKEIQVQVICSKDAEEYIKKKLGSIKIKSPIFFQSPGRLMITLGFFIALCYIFSSYSNRLSHVCTRYHDQAILKVNRNLNFFWKLVKYFFFILNIISGKISAIALKIFKILARKKTTVLFSPFGHYLNLPFTSVSIIYDLQHIDLAYMHSKDEIKIRDYHYRNSINESSKVITISEFCKRRIIDHYKVDDKKVHAIHLPFLNDKISDLSANADNAHLNITNNKYGKFFFIPANYWRHKNHKTLFIAINILLADGHKDLNFVFSGKFINDGTKDKLNKFINANKLNNNIFILDYISMTDIQKLYTKCLAVICPSLYEGFGMTVNEARYYKKPCLASDIPAHREIADNNSTFFFNPRSPEDIYKKIKNFLSTNVAKYNFTSLENQDKTFEKYIEVILGYKN